MAPADGPGVAFVYPFASSFVEADRAILERHFRVLPYEYRIRKGAPRELLRFLREHRREYGVVLVWFGDVYATVAVRAARLLRKASVVVAGGFDTTYLPDIGYGLLSTPKKRRWARAAFGRATRVLVVDASLKEELSRNLGLDGSNVSVLPTGYDPSRFHPSGDKDRRLVATVASVSADTVKVKGLDAFVEAAKALPDFRFRIVGGGTEDGLRRLRAASPDNVAFVGRVPHDEMPEQYRAPQVYVQASRFEGLPNALAEAMLTECVPVGTRVGGIPTLIGDCGFYVPAGDPAGLARAIAEASGSGLGPQARARVASEFPIARREAGLLDVVREVSRP